MENFILESYLQDTSICDAIIEYHNSTAEKRPGNIYGGVVDKKIKDSTDSSLSHSPFCDAYVKQLQIVANEYIEKFPACNMYNPWGILEGINVQHYAPGQGYPSWHTERSTSKVRISARHLVFLTYLNDVTELGGTEFMNQKITIAPRKGKTLIWPVDWTYTHRGIISPTQDKYIVTGWFSYVK